MSGRLLNKITLSAEITSSVTLKGSVIIPETVGVTPPAYKGDYNVTPTVSGETLQTKYKYMEEDLVLKPIPIYETTNNSGGLTVYIAKE